MVAVSETMVRHRLFRIAAIAAVMVPVGLLGACAASTRLMFGIRNRVCFGYSAED
jgi:hypothetical protein